jgi:hypothetical protein
MSFVAEILLVLLGICWVSFVGWAIARLFRDALSLPEVLAWSFACGLLFQARLYEALLFAGVNPGATLLVAAGGFAAVLSFLFRRPARPQGARTSGRGTWALVAALSVPLLVFTLESIAEPMWTTDYLAIWGYKAKTIFLSGSIPRRLFLDPSTFWSHPEYPLLLPLSLASLSALLGRFDDQAMALLYPALGAATVLLLFGHLRRRVSFGAATVATILTACCFPLYRGVNVGAAEIPLAFAFVLAATAALDAIEQDTLSARLRLLIASHVCATLKQEGALFAGLLALALLVRWLALRRNTSPIPALCLFLPATLHLAARRVLTAAVPHTDYDFSLLSPGRWSDWSARGLEVVRHLVRVELAADAIPIAGLIVFFLFSRRRREDLLLPVLLGQAAAYAGAASLSAWGSSWALESSFSRTAMALVPAFSLVLAARASLLPAVADSTAGNRVTGPGF